MARLFVNWQLPTGGGETVPTGKYAVMTNRIREVRKSKHVTLEDLADQTGISTSFLSRIESGGRGLSLENALRIARSLGCDVQDVTDEFSQDDVDRAVNLNLTDKASRAGDVINLNIHAGMGNGGLEAVEGAEGGIVPANFTSGYWSFPDDIRSGFQKIKQTYAMPVVGDSMEPTLSGGSVVFVDTSHTLPSPPDLYAVDYGDGLMIKRIELIPRTDKVQVISDNDRYGKHELPRNDVRVYGRVVAAFQWRG